MRNISVSLQSDRLMLSGRILLRESPTCLMDKLRSKRTWNGKARQKSWDEIFGSEMKTSQRWRSKELLGDPGFLTGFLNGTNRWSWSPSDRHHRTSCPPGFWPCSSPGWGIHRDRCCPANCAAISRRRPLCAAFSPRPFYNVWEGNDHECWLSHQVNQMIALYIDDADDDRFKTWAVRVIM